MIPITMRCSCVNTLIFGFLLAGFAAHAAPPVQAALEPSAFLDTESSTNLAFQAWRSGRDLFRFELTLTATPSNNIQVAFGVDRDEDGDMALEEIETIYGWECGEWFACCPTNGARMADPRNFAGASQTLRCTFQLDPEGGVAAFHATDREAPLFTDEDDPQGWLFSPAWNIARVIVRGAGDAGGTCVLETDTGGLRLILR